MRQIFQQKFGRGPVRAPAGPCPITKNARPFKSAVQIKHAARGRGPVLAHFVFE
jgi:hypothetical protein